MLLKKKTFFACIVKLMLCATFVHAQTSRDSMQQPAIKITPAYTNMYLLKQPIYQSQVKGDFYAKQLPFFCNKELQVQKATGIPIKFRLGSVEYCDKLEGKRR